MIPTLPACDTESISQAEDVALLLAFHFNSKRRSTELRKKTAGRMRGRHMTVSLLWFEGSLSFGTTVRTEPDELMCL